MIIYALAKNEFVLFWRSAASIINLGFFALLLGILFYFSEMGGDQTWTIVLLGSILQCNRSFDPERWGNVLEGIRLIPGVSPSLYIAKWLVNVLTLFILLAWVAVMTIVFFPVEKMGAAYLLPSILGIVGVAGVGTLFSSMVRLHRMRDMILPILMFPITLPLALAVSRWYAAIAAGEGMWETPWGHIVIAFDVIFTTAAWLLFPTLLRE